MQTTPLQAGGIVMSATGNRPAATDVSAGAT